MAYIIGIIMGYGVKDINNWANSVILMDDNGSMQNTSMTELKNGIEQGVEVENIRYTKSSRKISGKYYSLSFLDVKNLKNKYIAIAQNTKSKQTICVYYNDYLQPERVVLGVKSLVVECTKGNVVNIDKTSKNEIKLRCKQVDSKKQWNNSVIDEALEREAFDVGKVWDMHTFEKFMSMHNWGYELDKKRGTLNMVDPACRIVHIPYGVREVTQLFKNVPNEHASIIISSSVACISDICKRGSQKVTLRNIRFQKRRQGEEVFDGSGLSRLKITDTAKVPHDAFISNLYNNCDIECLEINGTVKQFINCLNDTIFHNTYNLYIEYTGNITSSFNKLMHASIKLVAKVRGRNNIVKSFNDMSGCKIRVFGENINIIKDSFNRAEKSMESIYTLENINTLQDSFNECIENGKLILGKIDNVVNCFYNSEMQVEVSDGVKKFMLLDDYKIGARDKRKMDVPDYYVTRREVNRKLKITFTGLRDELGSDMLEGMQYLRNSEQMNIELVDETNNGIKRIYCTKGVALHRLPLENVKMIIYIKHMVNGAVEFIDKALPRVKVYGYDEKNCEAWTSFNECGSLERIILEHARTLHSLCFTHCNSLKSVVLGHDIEFIDPKAFDSIKDSTDGVLDSEEKIKVYITKGSKTAGTINKIKKSLEAGGNIEICIKNSLADAIEQSRR